MQGLICLGLTGSLPYFLLPSSLFFIFFFLVGLGIHFPSIIGGVGLGLLHIAQWIGLLPNEAIPCFLVQKTGPTKHAQPILRFSFVEDQGPTAWTHCSYHFASP